MKILVAGTGFIGSKIVEDLQENHVVKTLDRSQGDYQHDITEEFEIDEEFDVLFHTIGLAPGMNSREQYEEVHVSGTKNLLEAVKADKIVYLSALGVGEVRHSFFQTKQTAENLIKKTERYTIVRPSTVYGQGNKLLEMIKKASPLRLFPDLKTRTQPIHIDDLVEILGRSAEEFDKETLAVAGPEKMTVGELATILYREEGRRCYLIPVPKFLLEAPFQIAPFSVPFSKENIQLLRQQNTVEENDAERILMDLKEIS